MGSQLSLSSKYPYRASLNGILSSTSIPEGRVGGARRGAVASGAVHRGPDGETGGREMTTGSTLQGRDSMIPQVFD